MASARWRQVQRDPARLRPAAVAGQNADGSRVFILTDRGQEKDIECRLGGQALALHLPADSITLHWSSESSGTRIHPLPDKRLLEV
jgi:hypothetical protein